MPESCLIFEYRATNWKNPAACKHLKKPKPVQRMNEEINCITNAGKTAKNEWENGDSDLLVALYSVYKKLGQFFL